LNVLAVCEHLLDKCNSYTSCLYQSARHQAR
jgi:hypothetical protein